MSHHSGHQCDGYVCTSQADKTDEEITRATRESLNT